MLISLEAGFEAAFVSVFLESLAIFTNQINLIVLEELVLGGILRDSLVLLVGH